MRLISPVEQFAIEARLNAMLGVTDYDTVFPGIEFHHIAEGILTVYARNEWCAGLIEARYSYEVALAAEAALKQPVAFVNLLPRQLRATNC